MGTQDLKLHFQNSIAGIDYQILNKLLIDNSVDYRYDAKHTKIAFENSQHYVFLYDDKQLIGAVRAISDGEWAVVFDFVVDKKYDINVRKKLVNKFVEELKGQHIFITTESEDIRFFEETGFQRTKTAFTYTGDKLQERKEFDKLDEYFLPVGYKFENEFFKPSGRFANTHKVPEVKKEVSIHYSDSRESIDYSRVSEILRTAFGHGDDETDSPERIARVKELFEMSDYVQYAYDGDKLIGVARAITDKVEQAYLQNVAVDPTYQGYGVGLKIVNELGEKTKKDGLLLFLHTHPGAVGFYNRKGFLRNKTSMDYVNPDMPPEIAQGFYVPLGYRFENEIK